MWSTPAALATAMVWSVLPSSMIIHSTRAKPGTARGRLASVMPRLAASLKQGIWMISFGPVMPAHCDAWVVAAVRSLGRITSNRRASAARSPSSGSGRSQEGAWPSARRW